MLTAAACRRGVAAGTLTLAACLALAVPAAPARADSVRGAEQWVLTAVNAPAAWPVSRGAGVTVAVIDSGVSPEVPDLAGSVRPGPDLTHVGTPPGNPNWGMHGTWMASLIAGHGHGRGGSAGVIGVAPGSRVLSIRVITDKSDPGYPAYQRQPLSQGQQELAAGITAAVRDGASVISMSLGYGAPSSAVRAALQAAYARNVVVVASSGNSGDAAGAAGQGSAPYSFPADYPGVLGVAAVDSGWRPASFSSENLSVQVAAPGVNVPAEGRDSQYWLVSGTSPACALTAGVAALVKSRYPGLSGAQVIDAITGSAWHRPAGGYDQQVGFGTVNAARALAVAGQIARRDGGAATAQAARDATAASHFGGGPAAVPPSPVPPRGPLALALYALLGAACLAALAFAAVRLVTVPRGTRAAPAAPRPLPPTPGWSLIPPGDADAPAPAAPGYASQDGAAYGAPHAAPVYGSQREAEDWNATTLPPGQLPPAGWHSAPPQRPGPG